MRVSELISILKHFPSDIEVFTTDDNGDVLRVNHPYNMSVDKFDAQDNPILKNYVGEKILIID